MGRAEVHGGRGGRGFRAGAKLKDWKIESGARRELVVSASSSGR
jgi:hypothetical protein